MLSVDGVVYENNIENEIVLVNENSIVILNKSKENYITNDRRIIQILKRAISPYIYVISGEKRNNFNYVFKKKWVCEKDNNERKIRLCSHVIKDGGIYYFINAKYRTIDKLSYKSYLAFQEGRLDHKGIEYLLMRHHVEYWKGQKKSIIQIEPKQGQIEYVYYVFSYACNMNCLYCFEHQNVRQTDFDKNRMQIFLEYIDSCRLDRKIVINFYGGEPLLEENRYEISQLINQKDKENIYYRIITNGINIKLFLEEINEIKGKLIEVLITLDGDRNMHNKRRVGKKEEDVYTIILENIKILLTNNIFVSVRVNVDKNNINCLRGLLDDLILLKGNLLSVILKQVKYTDREKKDLLELSLYEMYQLKERIKNAYDLNIVLDCLYENRIWELKQLKQSYLYWDSCSSCRNGNISVFDIDGKMYWCNEKMGDRTYLKQDTFVNNISNNINVVEIMHKKCAECDLYNFCGGGCDKEWILYGDGACQYNDLERILQEEIKKIKEEQIGEFLL